MPPLPAVRLRTPPASEGAAVVDPETIRLPPAGRWARHIRAGQHLSVRQVEGGQAVDLVAVDPGDLRRHQSMYVTQALNGSWQLHEGAAVHDVDGRTIWRVERTTTDVHYLGGGYCSAALNLARYGDSDGDCRTNLETAMHDLGGAADHVTPDACLNLFMSVGYEPDGTWRIRPNPTAADDIITLRAEVDLAVALSNCPQVAGPTNGHRAKPIDLRLG